MNWRKYTRRMAGANGQIVYLVVLGMALCATVIACDNIELATETINRAEEIKTHVEKRFSETKDELTGKAEEIKEKIREDIRMAVPKDTSDRTPFGEGKKRGKTGEKHDNEDKR